MRIVYTILLSVCSLLASAAADSLRNYNYGVNYLGGRIYLHTPKIYTTAPPFTQALELSWAKQTLGNAPWQQRFGYPETALNACVTYFGSAQTGFAAGLYPSIQFRLWSLKKSYFFFKVGGGIGLVNKKWKRYPYADSLNNIVGSTLNNFTMIQAGYRHHLNTRWSIQGGFHFFHVSNAGARKPNFGYNTMGAFIGLRYHPQGIPAIPLRERQPVENPLHVFVQSTISFAEDKTPNGPIYANYGFSTGATKMYRGKSRAGAGLEAMYQSRLYALYKNTNLYPGKERANAWIFSLYGTHEFVFGIIGLPLQLGLYLNKPNGGYPIYERLGINWHFYQKRKGPLRDIYLGTLLKTHYFTADYAELTLGLMF